jgi:polysaccharide export outer membrane protein
MKALKTLPVLLLSIYAAICCAQTESLVIGPADGLTVKVLEAPELTQSARVTDSGEFPLIVGGDIKIAGLTTAQAVQAIEKTLIAGNYFLNPHVTITVDHYATLSVTVLGEVKVPGNHETDTPRTVLDVISLSGGLTPAAARRITIQRRGTKERIEYTLSNNAGEALDPNIVVNPGDTVFIPRAGIVYMLGDFVRPGGIAMDTNDTKLSALQALTYAGGTPPNAVPSHARLIRKQADGTYANIALPLAAMQKGKQADIQLQADDIVYVPFSYLRNMAININGLVSATGAAAIYHF